jgi:hypothetical protein
MHQTNHRGHNETSTGTTQNQLAYKAVSVPGLVVMVELGVCQHYSDLFEPNCPDQDDTSVRFVIGVPVGSMRSMRLAAAASSEC